MHEGRVFVVCRFDRKWFKLFSQYLDLARAWAKYRCYLCLFVSIDHFIIICLALNRGVREFIPPLIYEIPWIFHFIEINFESDAGTIIRARSCISYLIIVNFFPGNRSRKTANHCFRHKRHDFTSHIHVTWILRIVKKIPYWKITDFWIRFIVINLLGIFIQETHSLGQSNSSVERLLQFVYNYVSTW